MTSLFISAFVLSTLAITPPEYFAIGQIQSQKGEYPFVVAIAKNRALSGYITPPDKATFSIAGVHKRRVDFGLKTESLQIGSSDVSFKYAVLTKDETDDSPTGHWSAVQTARFSKFPFAVFLGSEYVGIESLSVAGNGRFANQCGTLRVQTAPNGGIQKVEFEQQESDLLTIKLPKQTLALTTHPHASGLKDVRYETTFTPPFDGTHPAWEADCIYSVTPRDGQQEVDQIKVIVTHFTTDPDEINKRLDQYLSLIPNGEVLQTSQRDPITHVWQDGKVVRHLDNSAVAIAADAEFAKSTSRRWLWLLLVITGMVCVTAFWVRHHSRGQA
ncbi:MAG: hypothetical protein JNM43_02805 [Planctomycetaceae bacterium]|nr:hypothetical protein [Planctomycetaceae bacterium]